MYVIFLFSFPFLPTHFTYVQHLLPLHLSSHGSVELAETLAQARLRRHGLEHAAADAAGLAAGKSLGGEVVDAGGEAVVYEVAEDLFVGREKGEVSYGFGLFLGHGEGWSWSWRGCIWEWTWERWGEGLSNEVCGESRWDSWRKKRSRWEVGGGGQLGVVEDRPDLDRIDDGDDDG